MIYLLLSPKDSANLKEYYHFISNWNYDNKDLIEIAASSC